MLMYRNRRHILTLLLIPLLLLLALSACEEEDDSNGTTLESSGPAGRIGELQEEAITPSPASEDVPATGDLPGELLFIQGSSLYHLTLDPPGLEPVLLVDDVPLDNIDVSPTGRWLIVTAPGDGNPAITAYSADNLEGQLLWQFGRPRNWSVQGWSPGEEWVVLDIANEDPLLVELATGEQHTFELAAEFLQPLWLADGRVLLSDVAFNELQNTATLHLVHLYNPATGETEVIDEGFPVEVNLGSGQPTTDPLEAIIADRGLEPVYPDNSSSFSYEAPEGIFSGSAEVCAPWQITYPAQDETLYTAEAAFKFTNLTEISDEELLFLEWHLADCERIGQPSVDLVWVNMDGVAEPLVSGVFPGTETVPYQDPRRPFGTDLSPFAPSPDGRHVAWAGGSVPSGESTLNLLDRATGESVSLLDVLQSGTPAEFINEQVIQAVYWLVP
jgi:hypothetical protein